MCTGSEAAVPEVQGFETACRVPETNIFVLPHGRRFIVYAPVRGLVLEMNAEAVRRLKDHCLSRGSIPLPPSIQQRLGDTAWIFEPDRLDSQAPPAPFEPDRVTLFLTNRCNLRCRYCYAAAGGRPAREMSDPIAAAAIDLAWQNAALHGTPLQVGFHGGGEPTLAWRTLTRAVAHAESLTRGYRPGLKLALTTNGLLASEQIDYLADHFPGIMLSLDGPRDIQDAQRPRAGGGGSFDAVMATVKRLRAKRLPFAIRATITRQNVTRMPEMVDFFVSETGCRSLHFEPAFACGRCARSGDVPDGPVFARAYLSAFRRGIDLGAAVRYSAGRLMGRRTSFCGAAQGGFNVTLDGLVSACYEVCDAAHPLADTFIYGRFDRQTGRFGFDRRRLDRLRAMVVKNKPHCENCFCRWQCAGDCPVRVEGTRIDFASASPRCEMNQTILKGMLVELVERHPWEPPQKTSS